MLTSDFFNKPTTEEKTRLDPKCWTGKKIGDPKTKMKGGVRVNNCVPVEEEAETNPIDTVKMAVPLLIRALEYAREDAKDDMDLHKVVERMIVAAQAGDALNMDDYNMIFGDSEQGVEEATGDKPFDSMMKNISTGTAKQKTADRKEQRTQTQQQARDAFGNMFGGGNPADKLKIKEQGRFAGDTPVDVGDVIMKTTKSMQVGDIVMYLGQKAEVVAMSKDRKRARITIEKGMGGVTQDVNTSDLKQLGKGVAEGEGGLGQVAGIGINGKQFNFSIKDLIAKAQNYPIKKLNPQLFVKQLADRHEDPKQTAARAQSADLQYPIIVVQDGNTLMIADGTHRAQKAIMNKLPAINAHVIPVKDMAEFVKQGVAEGQFDLINDDDFYEYNVNTNEIVKRISGKHPIARQFSPMQKEWAGRDTDHKIVKGMYAKYLKPKGQDVVDEAKKKKKKKSSLMSKPTKRTYGGYFYPGYGYGDSGDSGGGDGGGGESRVNEKTEKTKLNTLDIRSELDSHAITLLNIARRKYPMAKSDLAALIKLVDRVQMHSKEKDTTHDKDIKAIRRDVAALEKRVTELYKKQKVKESRSYYTVSGTLAESLRKDFKMRKDRKGWFLPESADSRARLDAERAFGQPINEADLLRPIKMNATKDPVARSKNASKFKNPAKLIQFKR